MNLRSLTKPVFSLLFAAWLSAPALAQTPVPANNLAPVPVQRPVAVPLDRTAPVPATVSTVPTELTELRVYALKNAEAREANMLLQNLVQRGNAQVQIVADQRTNTLIVSGPAAIHERIANLVRTIDVPGSAKREERIVRVFRLRFARAQDLVKIIAPTFAAPEGRPPTVSLAADPATNSLLVMSNPDDEKQITALIEQLDRQAEATATSPGRRVRILWLVSGMELPPPPPDLKDVIEELDGLGIQNLRLVTQNIIQTVPGQEFSTTSVAPGFSLCRLKIEGTVTEKEGETPHLKISVSAAGRMPPKPQPAPDPTAPAVPTPPSPPMPSMSELASLMTTVVAPPGHKVVLGVAPIEQYTSVFVIQILPSTEARK